MNTTTTQTQFTRATLSILLMVGALFWTPQGHATGAGSCAQVFSVANQTMRAGHSELEGYRSAVLAKNEKEADTAVLNLLQKERAEDDPVLYKEIVNR